MKFINWIRTHCNKYAVYGVCLCIVLAFVLAMCTGCQGLANANGDGNQIVISRDVGDVKNEK